MEFYRIWRILVGNKQILIWLPLVATLVGLGLTYVLPVQYEATALVLVRPFQDIRFSGGGAGNKQALDFPVNLSAPIDAPSKTFMEVIKSEATATMIVKALHLDVPQPKTSAGVLDAIKDGAQEWFRRQTRRIVNYAKYGQDIPASPFELAVEAVEKNLAVSARKDTYVFDIAYRSSNPETAAAVANMAAQIFLEQSSTAYRKESARSRDFLATQLDDARAALDRDRAALLNFKNSGGTFQLKSEYEEKLKNLSDLENTLAKAEGKLAGLKGAGFKEGSSALALQAEIANLKQQTGLLSRQLADYPEKEKQLNTLSLNERLAEESYDFFRKQFEEARVKEAATVAEIRIVSPAVPSLYPVRPLKYVYAGLSFTTAIVVAIAWVLFFEALDPRVRTIRDVADNFAVPVLGAIPKLPATHA